MFGRSKLDTKWRAPPRLSRVGDLGPGGLRWPSRSARSAARPASARAARTVRGSRAGSRAPTGPRSAPRRWRTARSGRGRAAAPPIRPAAAPAPGTAGPARPPGTPSRPAAARPASWVELRNPARTPSAVSASTWSCISAMSGEMTTPVPVPDQRGDLVAQRLAAAGRHEHERVAAAGDVVDDLPLPAPERLVPEDPPQDLQRPVRHRLRVRTAATPRSYGPASVSVGQRADRAPPGAVLARGANPGPPDASAPARLVLRRSIPASPGSGRGSLAGTIVSPKPRAVA